jgi:hypothetical protein
MADNNTEAPVHGAYGTPEYLARQAENPKIPGGKMLFVSSIITLSYGGVCLLLFMPLLILEIVLQYADAFPTNELHYYVEICIPMILFGAACSVQGIIGIRWRKKTSEAKRLIKLDYICIIIYAIISITLLVQNELNAYGTYSSRIMGSGIEDISRHFGNFIGVTLSFVLPVIFLIGAKKMYAAHLGSVYNLKNMKIGICVIAPIFFIICIIPFGEPPYTAMERFIGAIADIIEDVGNSFARIIH